MSFCLLLFPRAFEYPPRKFLTATFLHKGKNLIVPIVVTVTLLYHPFLLLYYYYVEIGVLSTNQIPEISRLLL